jgi:DNA-binding NarL/FixJ family response regulator
MSVKVLILEDNPVARDFLSRVLRESFSDPIQITEAGDLETARRHIALSGPGGMHGSDPFKLMLVDLELPDGNGLELLAELGGYPATKVVTTLYSDDDHLFPARSAGPTATCSRKTVSRCWWRNCARSCWASPLCRRPSRGACSPTSA